MAVKQDAEAPQRLRMEVRSFTSSPFRSKRTNTDGSPVDMWYTCILGTDHNGRFAKVMRYTNSPSTVARALAEFDGDSTRRAVIECEGRWQTRERTYPGKDPSLDRAFIASKVEVMTGPAVELMLSKKDARDTLAEAAELFGKGAHEQAYVRLEDFIAQFVGVPAPSRTANEVLDVHQEAEAADIYDGLPPQTPEDRAAEVYERIDQARGHAPVPQSDAAPEPDAVDPVDLVTRIDQVSSGVPVSQSEEPQDVTSEVSGPVDLVTRIDQVSSEAPVSQGEVPQDVVEVEPQAEAAPPTAEASVPDVTSDVVTSEAEVDAVVRDAEAPMDVFAVVERQAREDVSEASLPEVATVDDEPVMGSDEPGDTVVEASPDSLQTTASVEAPVEVTQSEAAPVSVAPEVAVVAPAVDDAPKAAPPVRRGVMPGRPQVGRTAAPVGRTPIPAAAQPQASTADAKQPEAATPVAKAAPDAAPAPSRPGSGIRMPVGRMPIGRVMPQRPAPKVEPEPEDESPRLGM